MSGFVSREPDPELDIVWSRARALVALIAGVITGAFAAWAYYDDHLRPLAHTFELWIAMLALLSARQRSRSAVINACIALAAAVVAFFVGKKVMYGIDYPGMPYSINFSVLTEWLLLAVVAGAVLGWVFSWAGKPGREGAVGTGAVIGLLAADAYRRTVNYPWDGPVVVTFAALATVTILCLIVRSWRQLAFATGCAIPCALAGYVLISAPDLLEQLLITGRL